MSDTLNILQITDCHLNADPNADLLGVKTLESLDAVLQQIVQDKRKPDLVIVSGDLAQDASETAYQRLRERLEIFDCPKRWFCGNHDERAPMQSVVASGDELSPVYRTNDWQIIMLDSLVEGKVHGFLEASELALLEKTLKEQPETNTLVCLHHHPVDIDSAWLDNIGLHNKEAFWELLGNAPNVKAVLWGHIHQDFDREYQGVRLLASPSTCIQFLPQSDDFAIDEIAPGYRWLELSADGDIKTEVRRAEQFEFSVDMTSNGY